MNRKSSQSSSWSLSRSSSRSSSMLIPLAGGLVAAAVTAWFTIPATDIPGSAQVPDPIVVAVAVPDVDPQVRRAAFFDAAVQPAIADADERNRDAAKTCLKRIEDLLEDYRLGIDPFVDDLTSLSTRLGIVKRMPKAWYYSDTRIDDYVGAKFESHLFSEKTLSEDVASVLQQFQQDIEASQRRMLVDVQASLTTADLPEISLVSYDPFFESVAEHMIRYSESRGATSVANFAAVMVASEVGSQIFMRMAAGLLSRFAVTAAVGAAATGSASAGGSVAGAGVGTSVGPVGTVVGFGIGLAVGLVIDYWMSERFAAKLSSQLDQYLINVETTILDGSSSFPIDDAESANVTGLRDTLPAACDTLMAAYRERFYLQIVQPSALNNNISSQANP